MAKTNLPPIFSILMSLVCRSCAMNFRPVQFQNGTLVCAGDTPSFAVSFQNTDDVYPGLSAFSNPSNYAIVCGFYCSSTKTSDGSDGCIGFNVQPLFERCEFYSDVPKIWKSRMPCIYYEVTATTLAYYLKKTLRNSATQTTYNRLRIACSITCNTVTYTQTLQETVIHIKLHLNLKLQS